MKATKSLLKPLLSTIILIQVITSYLSGQQENKAEGSVSINIIVERDNEKALREATAKLFEKATLLNTKTSGNEGLINFKLNVNSEYIIEISKDKYVTKIINVNTTIPEYEKGSFEIAFSLLLFIPCEGLDFSVLQNPVMKLAYNDLKRDFLPEKNYDKIMVDKLQQLMKNNENCIEENYQKIVRKGDREFAEKKYTDALESYNKALEIRPDDQYVIDKISEINKITSSQKTNEKLYNDYIKQADAQFNNNKYILAKEFYKRALGLKPGATYPITQIQAIDKLLAQKNKTLQDKTDQEVKYQQLIKQGDKAFDNEDLLNAKEQYQKALALKPNEKYPNDQVKIIDNILAEQQRIENDKKLKHDQYNKTIAEADNAFKMPDYVSAKKSYQKALQILPSESYPKQKLAEIEDILKDVTNKNERDYNTKIQSGDKNFILKNYTQSKQDYQEALQIKPGEVYPTQRINNIDKILSEQTRIDADKKAKRDAYNIVIAKADDLYKSRQYDQSVISYKEASSYLPDEQYPYTRINDIKKIKQQLETEKNYKQSITAADQNFQKKQFEQAKSMYNQALVYKPGDNYATEQIKKADKEITDQLNKLANQKAKQDAYNNAVKEADKNYNLKDYGTALVNYQTAQSIFTDNPYPKQRIDEINKIQNQQKTDVYYKQLLDDADDFYAAKNYQNAKTKYKEANSVKPNEIIPVQKVKEIDKILAQQENEKQQQLQVEKNYNDAITKANNLYDKAQYDAAKKEYEKAQAIMPDESFPKQRITKINDIKKLLANDAKGKGLANAGKTAPVVTPKLTDLSFKSNTEREQYLKELLAKYPSGITCEIYKEKDRTTTRFVIIRENQANDFREIKYNWGGIDYRRNDKPVTQLYFNTQIQLREGEYFNQTEM